MQIVHYAGYRLKKVGASCRTKVMHGSRRVTGGPDPPPPPSEKTQNIGFLIDTGQDPLKIAKLPSQHSMLLHQRHASETPLNGVSLAADDGPLIVAFESYLPFSTKKKKKNVVRQNFLDPRMLNHRKHQILQPK